ncbi:glyoxylase-like metal-dependent hydrolase (beta-lactamase superfamily II) [Breznakibacter xylanolyticus]|uniref:Glyoxylase-like metal-dependent hydrolase (Beta-lactamase superfamily II) n=1 Tax=Breznakibacter xylanolyticus TaxID=990 RepID=A0A2W7NVX1_9BACT|nr:MBL fold metallo-hydrolase [Breznakibacter xylanolyticus]PZX20754.1 glyoxylase-like metal-dependent hydrolase (beta-lactamase superfamily II) [Breznakibacter xylanolyticus]
MIHITPFAFSPFQINTYVLHDDTKECIIVDPGCLEVREEQRLEAFITQNGLKPVKIVNTHLHLDHVFGSAWVADRWNLEIWAHEGDEFMLPHTVDHALSYGIRMNSNPPAVNHRLNEGDEVTFGNSHLKVLHVPGHSPGSVVLYDPEGQRLLAGDVLFRDSIGRTDLPGGSFDLLKQGITGKLFTLPDEAIVYPGHGPETTIGWEKKHNPYL